MKLGVSFPQTAYRLRKEIQPIFHQDFLIGSSYAG
jgi:hypothetical protein